ncbi:hypothetical protein LMG33818_000863 [Halomonadaceae bacterium LMG 33818]
MCNCCDDMHPECVLFFVANLSDYLIEKWSLLLGFQIHIGV